MTQLILACDLILSEEGMHPDGIYVNQGEEVEAYYYLPQLVHLLRENFVVNESWGDGIIRGLKITIEQERQCP